jgi:hypothetical protein
LGSEPKELLSWQAPAPHLPTPPSGKRHWALPVPTHCGTPQLSPTQTRPTPHGTPPEDEPLLELATLDEAPEAAPVLPLAPADVPPLDRPPELPLEDASALPPDVLEVEPRFPPQPARKQATTT